MRKTNIAEVVAVYPPYGGGLGTVAREQARMLSEEYNVTLVTPQYHGRAVPQSDLPLVTPVPLLSFGNAAWVPSLFFHLRSCDIIHLHYPFIGAALACVAARVVWRKKMVVTYHMDLVGMKGSPLRPVFALYQWLITPLVLYFADRITVTSRAYAHASRVRHLFKRYKKKVLEIPNSVDTNLFSPGKSTIQKKPLARNGERIILFVGGLDRAHYFKGVEVLLDAFSRVHREVNATLVFIGEGDCRQRYEKRARALGVQESTRFLGSVPDAKTLVEYYRSSDVVVLPSTDASEAFGVVLIEAGACAKPVIATQLPGPSSVVVNGTTGFVIPVCDVERLATALRSILDSPSRARQMGDAAHARVFERYSNTAVGERLRSLMSML